MIRLTAAEAAELYADGEGENGDVQGEWTLVGGANSHRHRQSRWHQRYWLVVRNGQGEIYGVDFGYGLTENQENDLPWEDVPDGRDMTLVRLYRHIVTKTVYRTTPPEAVTR